MELLPEKTANERLSRTLSTTRRMDGGRERAGRGPEEEAEPDGNRRGVCRRAGTRVKAAGSEDGDWLCGAGRVARRSSPLSLSHHRPAQRSPTPIPIRTSFVPSTIFFFTTSSVAQPHEQECLPSTSSPCRLHQQPLLLPRWLQNNTIRCDIARRSYSTRSFCQIREGYLGLFLLPICHFQPAVFAKEGLVVLPGRLGVRASSFGRRNHEDMAGDIYASTFSSMGDVEWSY